MLRAGVVAPEPGIYVHLEKSGGPVPSTQFQKGTPIHIDTLPQNNVECHVCALGALFLASTFHKGTKLRYGVFGEVMFERDGNDKDSDIRFRSIANTLNDVFTESELKLIEQVFEWSDNVKDTVWAKEYEKATAHYVGKLSQVQLRLYAIMQTIIRAKGEFTHKELDRRPPPFPHSLESMKI